MEIIIFMLILTSDQENIISVGEYIFSHYFAYFDGACILIQIRPRERIM
ncbi:hypothetical protein Lalb_Chr07g0182611 [Lupinus albus]|uniref:Uncharacterized protein n=1 Tax=Lupinus albus TaxID=3870 RepID=A0A6A4Q8E9_LUPAL|nr:hypothetical protein Lalb_Chr07g0182611 [Lupinus albus]